MAQPEMRGLGSPPSNAIHRQRTRECSDGLVNIMPNLIYDIPPPEPSTSSHGMCTKVVNVCACPSCKLSRQALLKNGGYMCTEDACKDALGSSHPRCYHDCVHARSSINRWNPLYDASGTVGGGLVFRVPGVRPECFPVARWAQLYFNHGSAFGPITRERERVEGSSDWRDWDFAYIPEDMLLAVQPAMVTRTPTLFHDLGLQDEHGPC
mmetsp:Transcript_15514/g.37895  ORF Transcript_15514/g.37895 Transcript_15514/m.37895 type:complete len:209 (+) Transcript_15514:102-728(+)